jgi:Domain of unknown function (DUF4124)
MKRLLLFAALIAWSGMASAVVYKWVDAQGKLQYGDRPPDGVHAEIVEMPGNHAAAANARSAAARSDSPSPTPKVASNNAPAKGDDAQKDVDQDVAQTREKQCADAQDHYKKLIEGRKIYTTGTNGERQYLTSDQIDTERVNAKRDIDAICNSKT